MVEISNKYKSQYIQSRSSIFIEMKFLSNKFPFRWLITSFAFGADALKCM